MKVCTKCGQAKALDGFHPQGGSPDGRSWACRACKNAQRREIYAANRAPMLAKAREYRALNADRYRAYDRARGQTAERKDYARERILRRDYGIGIADFEEMFENQGGVCAICRRTSGRTLHVDHCHKRNVIRGLLCGTCNPSLGTFDDDPERLRRAADYLENPPANRPILKAVA